MNDYYWWSWDDDGMDRVLNFKSIPPGLLVHCTLKAVRYLGVPDRWSRVRVPEEAGENIPVYTWDHERDEWTLDK
jgi:hypothetical protein